jgi:Uma2 family endonuclease
MPDLAAHPMPEAATVPAALPLRPQHFYPVDEYLRFERRADSKHEYYAGAIYAMVGASEPHVLIVSNLIFCLRTRLRGRPGKVYATDMRLKVSPTGLYTYPDVMVVCGEAKLSDDGHDTLENPRLVVEVLSRSTETYDRVTKLKHYQSLESVTDYLLVAQDARRVEHHTRRADGSWARVEVTSNGKVVLPEIGCELPLDEIYEQIDLPA